MAHIPHAAGEPGDLPSSLFFLSCGNTLQYGVAISKPWKVLNIDIAAASQASVTVCPVIQAGHIF